MYFPALASHRVGRFSAVCGRDRERTRAAASRWSIPHVFTDWTAMRFYGGGPDQMPDPVYEAAVGAGNAPAYRGRSTVFIEGLNLGGSGQLPLLTFELVSAGTFRPDVIAETVYDTAHTYPGVLGGLGAYVGPGHYLFNAKFTNITLWLAIGLGGSGDSAGSALFCSLAADLGYVSAL